MIEFVPLLRPALQKAGYEHQEFFFEHVEAVKPLPAWGEELRGTRIIA
jgi:hypothetical protein